MTSRRFLRMLLVLMMSALTVYAVQPSAGATPPEAQAWWYLARSSEIPIATPVPPSVDDNGLYVAAGPNGAIAIAALRAPLGDVGHATITLELTDTSGLVALGACRTAPWFPVQAGNWDERPEPDCESGAVVGVVDDETTTVTFDVTSLVDGASIDVVIVPGETEEGAPANFTASIAPPNTDTIATEASADPNAAPTTATIGSPPATEPVDSGFTASPSGPPSFRPASGVSSIPPPQDGIEIPPQVDEVAAPTPAPRPRPRPASSNVPTSDSGRLLAIGIIAALGVGYVVLRGREGPLPAPLRRVGGASASDGAGLAPDPVVSGVGRFARERVGQAPPLS